MVVATAGSELVLFSCVTGLPPFCLQVLGVEHGIPLHTAVAPTCNPGLLLATHRKNDISQTDLEARAIATCLPRKANS